MKRKILYILILVLAAKIALSVYGINWGLPDRWNADERFNACIKIVTDRTFLYSNVEPYHPIIYYYFVFIWLLPYFLFLKLTGFDLEAIRSATSISWLAVTKASPGFANGLLIAERLSSAALGLLTVFIVYRIARKAFDEKTGIFSALILTLNVGMIGTNHFVKNENLCLFLIALIIYMWLVMLAGKFSCKKFYLSCFLAGLAIGTKLDSAIIIFGLVYMLYALRKRANGLMVRLKEVSFSAGFLLLGALLGYPRLVIPVKGVTSVKESAVRGFSILFATPSLENTFNQLRATFLKITSTFNLPITIFLLIGLFLCLVRLRNNRFTQVSLAILLPYYFVIVFLYSMVYANLIILSIPFLSIYAGYGFKMFWDALARRRVTRAVFAIVIFLYSMTYAVRADMTFACNDTRYTSTRWIEDNIPAGSSIGIAQEPEQLFSSRLLEKYPIYYNGTRMNYESNAYTESREKESWAKSAVMRKLSSCDYAVISTWNYILFERTVAETLENDVYGTGDWRLIKTIRYNEDLFLNPRPTYTCPVIFIFKNKGLPKGAE